MKKRICTLLLLLVLCFSFTITAYAKEGVGKSYTYNHKKTAVAIPDPYSVSKVLYGSTSKFNKPVDFTYKNDKLYILNGEDNTLSVLDKNFKFIKNINLTKDGKPYDAGSLKSVWIDIDGSMLFADAGKKVVIRTDKKGGVLAEYTGPDNEASKETEFIPYKVLTDYLGRIYVLSEGEYRGIIRLEANGEFSSYFGAKTIEVTAGVLLDTLWRKFMSDAQIENSARYLPTEYNNMSIDDKGFLFVSSGSSSSENEYIVKLNCNGSNVLNKNEYGDFNLGKYGNTYYKTSFNAIAVDDEGFITVADKTWNRIMQYSSEGELLYIFGGHGSQAGTFSENSQLLCIDDKLLIADSVNNSITVMTPTVFGENVRKGYTLYEKGLFEESIKPWEEVIASAGNYEVAFVGIGKALQLKNDYKGAMEYFKKGYSKSDYSDAYQRYRSQVMRQTFPIFMTVTIILAVIAVVIFKNYRKKHPKVKKEPLDKRGKVAYLFYTLIHPFDGYAEMRYNQKGSLAIGNILVFLWFMVEAIKFNYRGFIFNSNESEDFSIFALLVTTVGLAFMFCLSNWLFSTFFEGKGNFRNVWINFTYSLVPMLCTSIIDVILSNLLTLDESFFITYIGLFGTAYTLFLMFIGNGELHQYSFKKNIFSVLASCVGVLIMMFIVFLLFNLFMQIKDFAVSVFTEILYRINVGF